uniref:Uncharacterized protein n=1 Tax=Salmonella sp. TaxID=599 RepID=A0A482EV86_SALSP|nr:hypothetical protein NNIBIDOC_00009 [Salmonella sp.]
MIILLIATVAFTRDAGEPDISRLSLYRPDVGNMG